MRWAIIDDGVNLEIPEIVQNIEIDRMGVVKNRTPSFSYNHATMCFRIIQKYASALFDAVSIKILDDATHRANKDALIAALNWCVDNDIQLIHMSIGTTEHHDGLAIREMVERLTKLGVVIVAANSNKGIQTYPAYDKHVIGVECDEMLEGDQYIYTPNALNGITFHASARHQLLEDSSIMTPPSNSYAAPLITAKLIKLIKQMPGLSCEHAIEWLREDAVRTDENAFFTVPNSQEEAVVIVFPGLDRRNVGRLMIKLKALFMQDGYVCTLAAKQGFLLPQAEAIPDYLSTERYLNWAKRFFRCDVFLAALGEGNMDMLRTHADMIITDEACIVLGEDPPNDRVIATSIREKGKGQSTIELYKTIINTLSEEETTIGSANFCDAPTVRKGI